MNKKPNTGENSLVGSWVMKDGTMIQDSVCNRIQWLTDSFFEEITIDGDNWSALYKNPDDGEYWELTYPKSDMQGGGPPTLNRISKEAACQQYNIGSHQ